MKPQVSENFDPQFLEAVQLVIDLQEMIMDITNENVDETFENLLALENSSNQQVFHFFQEGEFQKFIKSTLLTAAHYRPLHLSALAQLTGKLFLRFEELKPSLLNLPLRIVESPWQLALLFECFDANIISEDDVMNMLNYYKTHYSKMDGSLMLIFQYFHLVFKKKDPEFYEQSFNFLIQHKFRYDLKISEHFLMIRNEDLKRHDSSDDDYDDEEEEESGRVKFNQEAENAFNDIIKNWYPRKSLLRIIRDDDLERFKEETVANPYFDVNTIFRNESIFCYSEILQHNCNYICLAAFFGSINIFTYLLEIGANTNSYRDGGGSSLIKYAIAGGNIDIIQKCEIDPDNIQEVIDSVSEYFRFSVFQWIYDNKLGSLAQFSDEENDDDNDDNNNNAFVPMNRISQKVSFLNSAAKANNIQMLIYLLENEECRFDVNQSDYGGWTPLHFAAKFRNIEAIKVILNCKSLKIEPRSYHFFYCFLN